MVFSDIGPDVLPKGLIDIGIGLLSGNRDGTGDAVAGLALVAGGGAAASS
jgi:hypothetical protein